VWEPFWGTIDRWTGQKAEGALKRHGKKLQGRRELGGEKESY